MASKDATENYNARALETELLIRELAGAFALHKVDQAKQPRNWEWSGDLAEVNQRLHDLIAFLGGNADSADAAHGMSPDVTAAVEPPMSDLFELVIKLTDAVYEDRDQESLADQQRRQTVEIPTLRIQVTELILDNLGEMEIEILSGIFDNLIHPQPESDDDNQI